MPGKRTTAEDGLPRVGVSPRVRLTKAGLQVLQALVATFRSGPLGPIATSTAISAVKAVGDEVVAQYWRLLDEAPGVVARDHANDTVRLRIAGLAKLAESDPDSPVHRHLKALDAVYAELRAQALETATTAGTVRDVLTAVQPQGIAPEEVVRLLIDAMVLSDSTGHGLRINRGRILGFETLPDLLKERVSTAFTQEAEDGGTESEPLLDALRKNLRILAAAVHVMQHYRDDCVNKNGKFVATKIARLLDDHAHKLFPMTGGKSRAPRHDKAVAELVGNALKSGGILHGRWLLDRSS